MDEKIIEIKNGDALFVKNKKTQEAKWVLFDYIGEGMMHCYWLEDESLCDDFLKIEDYVFSIFSQNLECFEIEKGEGQWPCNVTITLKQSKRA